MENSQKKLELKAEFSKHLSDTKKYNENYKVWSYEMIQLNGRLKNLEKNLNKKGKTKKPITEIRKCCV